MSQLGQMLLIPGHDGSFVDHTIVSDTFTDPNATELSTHTGEIGATWTKHPSYSANLTIHGGRIYGALAANGAYYASGVPPTANQQVSVDVVKLTDLASSGICLRMVTNANTFYFFAYTATGATWTLFKFVAGTPTSLGTFPQALTTDQPYRMTALAIGSTISLMVDGVTRISVTDTAITDAGRVGVRITTGASTVTGYHLDNLLAVAA